MLPGRMDVEATLLVESPKQEHLVRIRLLKFRQILWRP